MRFSMTGIATLCVILSVSTVSAQPGKLPDRIGFSPPMGDRVPLDAAFRDHNGKSVTLGDYFEGQPVVVMPVYYRCPMLCGLELNGLVRCLRGMQKLPGRDFQIVTFSIDHEEGPELAAKKRNTYLAELDKEEAAAGWHFLTGDEGDIQRVCQAIGFRAERDERTGQYAHAAGFVVCTPEGQIARAMYGVEFQPRDLNLALVEASRGKIATLADQIQLYCYMYDPTTGKYGVAILALVRAAGLVTALALFGSVAWMLHRERRGKELAAHG